MNNEKKYNIGNMGELITKAHYSPNGALVIPRDVVLGELDSEGNQKSYRGITTNDIPGLFSDAVLQSGAEALHITFFGLTRQLIEGKLTDIKINTFAATGEIIPLFDAVSVANAAD